MRICHIVHRYSPAFGGAEKYMQELSEGFVAQGHSVDVYTTNAEEISYFWNRKNLKVDAPESEKLNGVNIYRLPIRHIPAHRVLTKGLSILPMLGEKYAPHYPWIPGFVNVINRAKPGDYDIVHATAFPYMSILHYAKRLAEKINRPLVITPFIHIGEPHNTEVRKYYTSRSQLALLRQCSKIIVHTTIERDFLLKHGIDPAKLFLMGLWVDLQKMQGGRGEEFRKRYGINRRSKLLGFIGTKCYDKGTIHLIESYIRLKKSGHDVRLVLAGQQIDDFRIAYSTLPNHWKREVINLDTITEEWKLHLLDALDIFVMPSRTDTFGFVYLESWAYEKPVIGTSAGGVPDVIQDGHNGFLVPFGDVDRLTARIEELLNHPERAKQMGTHGRHTVEDRYMSEKKFPMIEALYASLAAE